MQNGPILGGRVAALQHMPQRVPGPHGVHQLGPRIQPPNVLQMSGPVAQGMQANTYTYANPNPGAQQAVQVGKCRQFHYIFFCQCLV